MSISNTTTQYHILIADFIQIPEGYPGKKRSPKPSPTQNNLPETGKKFQITEYSKEKVGSLAEDMKVPRGFLDFMLSSYLITFKTENSGGVGPNYGGR